MVNFAKYINRNDTKGLQRAIEYSFESKFKSHPKLKSKFEVIDRNNDIAEIIREVEKCS